MQQEMVCYLKDNLKFWVDFALSLSTIASSGNYLCWLFPYERGAEEDDVPSTDQTMWKMYHKMKFVWLISLDVNTVIIPKPIFFPYRKCDQVYNKSVFGGVGYGGK